VQARLRGIAVSTVPLAAGCLGLLGGLAALVAAMVPVGPDWLGGAGAVAVVSIYSWALAARTGGRPVVFGTLALALGVLVLVADEPVLRTGAAVMTCVVSAVLAVMATVPAVTFPAAAREAVVAVLVAGVGALATVGFEPVITLTRFEYATLGLAVLGAFGVVFRLGAGLHGLGRRGIVIVLVGTAVLALTLLYAELLRRYGTPGLVATLLEGVHWSRNHLGAFPRPIESVLGIPALAWGCHMRARRRQGWWVCAFGVAATAPIATRLVSTDLGARSVVLGGIYSFVVGAVVGYLVIRVEQSLTGSHGRRARRDEEAEAHRPEPRRTRPLH